MQDLREQGGAIFRLRLDPTSHYLLAICGCETVGDLIGSSSKCRSQKRLELNVHQYSPIPIIEPDALDQYRSGNTGPTTGVGVLHITGLTTRLSRTRDTGVRSRPGLSFSFLELLEEGATRGAMKRSRASA